MKKRIANGFIVSVLVCSFGMISVLAWAGPDFQQRQLYQRIHHAEAKLKAAGSAKGEERQKLMSQHMQMMQEIMDKMKAMQPKAGMSMQEHEEWINEHQKMMELMLGQMMKEHHMLMDMNKPVNGQ